MYNLNKNIANLYKIYTIFIYSRYYKDKPSISVRNMFITKNNIIRQLNMRIFYSKLLLQKFIIYTNNNRAYKSFIYPKRD